MYLPIVNVNKVFKQIFFPAFYIFFLLVSLRIFASPVLADGSCYADISPTPVDGGTSVEFSVIGTNMSINNGVVWVKITPPSDKYAITGTTTGWSHRSEGNSLIFTGGLIRLQYDSTFPINVDVDNSNQSSSNWTVQMADNDNGENSVTCTGNVSTQIVAQEAGLSFGDISLTVGQTDVTINWTTNVASTSEVTYTNPSNVSKTITDTNLTTAHSITLSNLTMGTIYRYFIKSTTIGNNSLQSAESSFSTTTPGITPIIVSTTVTVTQTSTVTIVVSPTPGPDTIAPVLTLNAPPNVPYRIPPKISGTAIDNSGVSNIEYNIDNTKTWQTVKSVTNLGNKSVDFSLNIPFGNGMHSLKVRARDTFGNIGTSKSIPITIDKESPKITLYNDFSKPFIQSPQITGNGTDSSGESTFRFSLDAGRNWLPVDSVTLTSPTVTDFSFTPAKLDDGNYDLHIEATDSLGNIATSSGSVLVIDRLPPIVGSSVITVGPQVLKPDNNGFYSVVANLEQKITLSAVGGPTNMEINIKDIDHNMQLVKKLHLVKYTDPDLWQTIIRGLSPGKYAYVVHAVDGAKNETDKTIANVNILSPGVITGKNIPLSNAQVEIYAYDTLLGRFMLWDSSPYDQINPFETGINGEYGFILPAGRYYIQIKSVNYRTLVTDMFTLKDTTSITENYQLNPKTFIQVGGWSIPIPDFTRTYSSKTPALNTSSESISLNSDQMNQQFPDVTIDANGTAFTTANLRGKPYLITLLNTWSPFASAQMEMLETFKKNSPAVNILVIVPEESASSVVLWQKRAGYSVDIIADPDALISRNLPYNFAPMNLVLDRSNKIAQSTVGVLTADQIIDSIK
jgi:hypothetical protein